VFDAGALMVKTRLPDVPPPGVGFMTATLDVPAVVRSADGTTAVSAVDETNVVTRSVPFHCATDVPTKFVPSMVSVRSECPAMVEVGLIETSVGTGFAVAVTVKITLFDVPPPGAGFTTVMG